MSRGKHAVSAAARQTIAAKDADLGTYQHRVARLTAENRELRERLSAQERIHVATERTLRAERDEGLSPQLRALELRVEAEKQKLTDARRAIASAIGELAKQHDLRMPMREWANLAAILRAPVSDLLGESLVRSARRGGPKHMKHIDELITSGRMSSGGKPGNHGPGN